MAGIIGAGVTVEGLDFPDFEMTYLVSGTIADTDKGKAVTLDTTADNTVKLAGDGDPIFGRLITYENRVQEGIKVGTVAKKFSAALLIKTGETVNVGDAVVGAGSGEVKALAVVANVAGNTVGDINTAIAAINANIKARNNIVVDVVTRNSKNYAITVKV